ncbi:MAG: signal peptide peptidase SppA [Rhizonema sp. PD38]|nr:signal peptide peptidase SppA [Rhizonema sp. PD38]
MRNFIKQTFASAIGSLLGLIIFCGLGTAGLFLLLLAVSSKEAAPSVKDKSVLVFDLSMNISDSEPSSSEFLQKALSGEDNNQMSLRTVLDTLEQARQDSRIVGIYLDATHPSVAGANGFATLKEVRQALEKFRATGKKVVAYGMEWDQKDYYLSSVADTIMLNPLGEIEVKGLGIQTMFLAGALQKYGVGVQIVREGKFKGAVEPFILTKFSPENREQTQKLLNDVWTDWRTSVGTSRKIDPQQLQAIADNQALLLADQAKTSHLVDKIGYFDEVIADLKQLTDSKPEDKTFRQISFNNYAEVYHKPLGRERFAKNRVAVVYAEGEIVDGQGSSGEVGGDRFAKIFRRLRQDRNVKAIVLRINSPGGSATAAEVMHREIRLTRQIKPVVVSMGDLAASGGYWIATDSNRIFAEPNTITGSIGVFGQLFNLQKLANDHGITWDTVKTGKYADSQTVSRPKSPEELALYQRSVDRIYNLFLNKVAQGRKLPELKVAEIAQGRVWSGTAAKGIGLIDEIGGLDSAIKYAAQQANLGDNWELQEYPKYGTFGEHLFGQVAQETRSILGIDQAQFKSADPLSAEFLYLQQQIAILHKMNDPQGVYARLPFNFQIK